MLLAALFVATALAACRSGYYTKTYANTAQSNSYLPASVAGTLVGSNNPCNYRACSSCGGAVNFPTATKTFSNKLVNVRGSRGFIAQISRVFADMRANDPALFNRIGTAGALCCRYIKRASGGCASSWSNHAFGNAIDLTVDGVLDPHGDNCIHNPLQQIAPYFTKYQFFWGAAFSSEDAMHFEVSKQLAQSWIAHGTPNPDEVPAPPISMITGGGSGGDVPCSDGSGVCQDTSLACEVDYVSGLCPNTGSNVKCCQSSSRDPDDPPPLPAGARGPCSFHAHSGACITTTQCRTMPGSAFSSRAGADGCQSFPTNVQCCIRSASLLEDEVGDVSLDGEDDQVEGEGLSTGAVVGIVIAAIIALVVVAALVFVGVRRSTAAAGAVALQESNVVDDRAATTGSSSSSNGQPAFL